MVFKLLFKILSICDVLVLVAFAVVVVPFNEGCEVACPIFVRFVPYIWGFVRRIIALLDKASLLLSN